MTLLSSTAPGYTSGATPPLVLGLDLSLTATGVARPDGSTLTIKTRTKDGDRRLVTIADTLADIIRDSGTVALAVIEDLPKHAMAAGITGMVHGVTRQTLIRAGIPYALLAPATLKAYATGKGSGDKTPMAMAAYKRAGREFDDDNQCDAAWLRWAGLDRLGCPEFPMPQAQRDRLDKAVWPVPGVVW